MSTLTFTDPGVSGGSVSYCDVTGGILSVHKWDCEELFIQWAKDQGEIRTAFIEKLTGYQKGQHEMVAAKSFVMGDNYGYHRGVFKTLGVTVKMLTPQKWQTGLRVRGKSYEDRKKALKELAVQRFPQHRVIKATCDAFLMADWHRRAYGVTESDVGL